MIKAPLEKALIPTADINQFSQMPADVISDLSTNSIENAQAVDLKEFIEQNNADDSGEQNIIEDASMAGLE
ncbi:unnamed protein product [Rotaria magnacalcarata]|uniref:Uncharacterized protein n=1 Tax=Rotaria magnacalcarata TaxID=392030 RepID=A0A816ZYJ9_9BILA|nr:unnamed protein product [Rotaria magnacalcarata]CAF4582587.1 unnamed protein product [Rotaria magnacalcarata]